MSKNILLLAGTGAMGTHLAPLLADHGYNVDVIARDPEVMPDPRINYTYTTIDSDEQVLEILTAKQLCRHNKPIAIYNILGYYEPLNRLMAEGIHQGFIKESVTQLYVISDDPGAIVAYLEGPQAAAKSLKELKDG